MARFTCPECAARIKVADPAVFAYKTSQIGDLSTNPALPLNLRLHFNLRGF